MKKVFWVYLTLTVFLMVSIFYFSAQPGEKSSAVSENVTKKVVTEEKIAHLPHKEADKQFETVETIIRKSAHFIIFSGLGFCIFMTFYHSGKMHKIYKSLLSLCCGAQVVCHVQLTGFHSAHSLMILL